MSVCELLQVTGQEWGLWEHVASRVGAVVLLCAPMQHVQHEIRRNPWAVYDVTLKTPPPQGHCYASAVLRWLWCPISFNKSWLSPV